MIAEVDREAIVRTDSWPALRKYVLQRGGLAPDVLAAEMPHECAEAAGLWADDDGSDAMLAALQLAWEAHTRACAARRVEASRSLPRGQRRLADHIDRLAERWGDRLACGPSALRVKRSFACTRAAIGWSSWSAANSAGLRSVAQGPRGRSSCICWRCQSWRWKRHDLDSCHPCCLSALRIDAAPAALVGGAGCVDADLLLYDVPEALER